MFGLNTGGFGETDETILQFIDQTGVTFPVLRDNLGTYIDYITGEAISPYPIDVVIDPEGLVAYINQEYNLDAMLAVILALLDE